VWGYDSLFAALDARQAYRRVGIIGIGGLGHLAVKFAAAYGCDVTAFTSSESKFDEARGFGANQVVSSRDTAAIKKLAGSFDSGDQHRERQARLGRDYWKIAPNADCTSLARCSNPFPSRSSRSFCSSVASPVRPRAPPQPSRGCSTLRPTRYRPQTEHFPMSRINDAFARLQSGKARYRIVLDADFDKS